METQYLSEIEQMRQQELEAALGKTPEQKTAEEAQALLDSQNAEAEAKRLAEEQAKTEVKAEETKVETTETEKSFLETLEETTQAPKVEIPEAIKAEMEATKAELEALKKEREQLENSDIAKLLKSGLTLEDIAKGITKVDYSNHSVQDLIRLELEKSGLKDADLTEALEQEMAAYENLTPLAKSRFDNELKANYKTEIRFDETTKLLDEKLKENAAKFQAPDPKQQQLAIEEMTKSDLSEIDGVFSSLKAQNFDIKDEDIKAIKESYNPMVADALYTTADKKFDVKKFIKDSYTLKFAERDKKLAVEAAEKRAYEKAKKEFANPDMSSRGGGGATAGVTIEEQLRIAEEKRLNGFNN